MKPKARFIISVVETAKECDTQMPWTRGTARVEFISRRSASARAAARSA